MTMRSLVLNLVIATLFVLDAAVFADTTVRTLTKELSVEEAEWVFIELPIGELEVKGSGGNVLSFHLKVKCEDRDSDKCRRAAEDIELEVDQHSDGIEIGIDHWPKFRNKGMSLEGFLEVPRQLVLEIDMGVGEVDISGMEDDIEIDIGVGEVSIEMNESEVRSVSLDAGVGDATLRVGGRTIEGSGFIGHGLDWREGSGKAYIEIDCGVGSIDVYLD
ncbi:MAG: hypothetical protein JSV84_01840 [Gemmatimonadota bacterium]|nr:MAG: hypothetical protein JSV84_01840 [Gemmatimonadota bacterium]